MFQPEEDAPLIDIIWETNVEPWYGNEFQVFSLTARAILKYIFFPLHIHNQHSYTCLTTSHHGGIVMLVSQRLRKIGEACALWPFFPWFPGRQIELESPVFH